MLSSNSRYATSGTQTAVIDGRNVTYLRRRTLPDPASLATRSWYRATGNERSDLVAAATIGDAEQYWQLLDANAVMRDDDLLAPGRPIRVPWPPQLGVTLNG